MVVMRNVSLHDCMTVVECSSCGDTADVLAVCVEALYVFPVCIVVSLLHLVYFYVLFSKDNSIYIYTSLCCLYICVCLKGYEPKLRYIYVVLTEYILIRI